MSKVCEYQGYYIDYDEETGEEDVLKCMLFTNEGIWDEYCYCDEEARNYCMLYKYSKYIENKDKEIERLNNIINELEKELDLNLPFKVVGVRHLKNKLQELKGVDKE